MKLEEHGTEEEKKYEIVQRHKTTTGKRKGGGGSESKIHATAFSSVSEKDLQKQSHLVSLAGRAPVCWAGGPALLCVPHHIVEVIE